MIPLFWDVGKCGEQSRAPEYASRLVLKLKIFRACRVTFPDWTANLTFRRFRIRTLLLSTTAVAFVIVAFKPFTPPVSLKSMVTAPFPEPFSHLDGRYRQIRLTVQNDGRLPVWLRPSDSLNPDDSWWAPSGGATCVRLDIYKDDCTKLAAGETRTYDVALHSNYEKFRLFVYARDWRGHDGCVDLGQHDTDFRKRGEQ
jgi:hypothetical protein